MRLRFIIILVTIGFTCFSFLALAANDGTLPASSSSAVTPGGSAPVPASLSATGISKPTIAPVSTTRATPTVISAPLLSTPIVTISPVVASNSSFSNSSTSNVGLIATIAVASLGFLGAVFSFVKKGQQNNNQDNRCDNVKEFLDQKKKELEDMVRSWPQEKIKDMATDRVLRELGRNESIKKVLDIAEDVKDKYDKLQGTIEMLQKRYDLCILSFPEVGATPYKGTIIENSLNDKRILENLEITKNYKLEDWLLNDVVVNEKQIEKFGEYMSDGPWYMHFWQPNKEDVIVVFKDKKFRIKYSDKTTWNEAIEYGKSIGIPEEQLDFTIQ